MYQHHYVGLCTQDQQQVEAVDGHQALLVSLHS